MSQYFMKSLVREESIVNLIKHSVLYEVYIILEDSHKFIRKIAVDRMNKTSKTS